MVSAIIVAAGNSVRMGGKARKQYLDLDGIPILARTIMAFNACSEIDQIHIVIPESDIRFCKQNILSCIRMQKPVMMVAGGKERQHSVYNGLLAIKDKTSLVVIHDGVRPFISSQDISVCIEGAKQFGACIMGVPVQETLKKSIPEEYYIEKTIDRKGVWLAQTPQAFSYELIVNAHRAAIKDGFIGTDDALLLERIGRPVRIVKGNKFNIKITTPDDLLFAEVLCKMGRSG